MSELQQSGAHASGQHTRGAGDQGMLASGSQFLTFMLAGEEYGIEILRIQEIRGWSKPTPMPSSPSFVRGVINLRGSIVPIIDLRERLGIPSIDYGPSTVVIVLSIRRRSYSAVDGVDDDSLHDIGLVVDAVSEVYSIEQDQIREAPELADSEHHFVSGLAALDEKLVILIDADRLVTREMMTSVARIEAEETNN